MAKTKKNRLVAPFVKWVGGKRQIMSSITKLMPKNIQEYKYIEPFIGGGAVLFHLQPKNGIINDFNEELINTYQVIKNDLDELLVDLKSHENTADYFYEIRALDRGANFDKLSKVKRAINSNSSKREDIDQVMDFKRLVA